MLLSKFYDTHVITPCVYLWLNIAFSFKVNSDGCDIIGICQVNTIEVLAP